MRKLNGKLIVSALIAASMVSVSAVSASAVDYGNPTVVYPAARTNTVDTNTSTDDNGDTTEETAGISENSPATVLSDEAVKEAIVNGDSIVYMTKDSSGKITVSEAAVGEIAKNDGYLTIETDDGYTVTITNIDTVKTINVAMAIETSSDGGTYDDVEVPAGSIIIRPAQSGNFGMTLTVTIPASKLKGLDTDNLMLFYIDDDGNVTDMSSNLVLDPESGDAHVVLTHASEYVITDVDLTDYADFDDDFDDDFEDDYDADADTDDDDVDDLVFDDAADDVKPSDEGKSDSATINDGIIVDAGDADSNPGTGVGIALGTLAVTAVSAAAIAVTSKKKRK